jgi:hypothetical protein
MKSKLLSFAGGIVLLSAPAFAASMCQTVLVIGNFQELVTAGSCNIGNVLFSGFNTNLTASNVLVGTNGGATSSLGMLLGFTYNYVGGTLPAGSIGFTATFDSTAGVACPALSACGIVGLAGQIHVFVPNPAVVDTTYSGGFVGGAHVDGTSLASQGSQAVIPIVSFPISVTTVSTYNGLGNLSSFESDVVVGSVSLVPEPTSLLLLGSGLLGLGWIKRRRSRPKI